VWNCDTRQTGRSSHRAGVDVVLLPGEKSRHRRRQTSRVVVLVVSRGRFAPRQRVVLFPVNGRIGINFQYIEDLLANGRPRL